MPPAYRTFGVQKNCFMKKMLLLAALVFCAFYSKANTFYFINMTGCTYTYHVVGVDPANPTVMFTSAPISVPPGTWPYLTPSSLPGLSGLPATVHYYFVRGWVNSSPATIAANVGNFPSLGFPTSTTIPPTNCHPQGNGVYFNGNSTGGNVVVLIN